MQSFGPEIVFSDREQQLGLPASIPRSTALGIADSLISGAFHVEANALQHFASLQSRHLGFVAEYSTSEPAPDMTHQVLSIDAYQRYALGRRLVEVAGSEIVNDIELDLRGQPEA